MSETELTVRWETAVGVALAGITYEAAAPLVDVETGGYEGCRCTGCSLTSGCECIESHGCFYTQRSGKTVLELRAFPRRLPLFECGSLCSCLASGLCAKRLCQSGITLKLVVRPSSAALGLGLFADQDVVKGEFVCLYSGERRTAAEAERIWTERQARGAGNYILALREWFGEGARQSVSSYIDPTLKGNVGRFANHACPPLTNLIILPIRPVGSAPIAAIFAARDITAGEELCFDYADAGGEQWFYGSQVERDEGVESEEGRTACRCGSIRCRKYIPLDRTLL